MSMKNWIIKNNKFRKILKKLEINKYILKNLLNNNNTLFNYKFIFEKFLKNQNFNASISRIKNYCILLNNNKSIIKKFKLSRYKIKLMAANGLLIGLKKSSF